MSSASLPPPGGGPTEPAPNISLGTDVSAALSSILGQLTTLTTAVAPLQQLAAQLSGAIEQLHALEAALQQLTARVSTLESTANGATSEPPRRAALAESAATASATTADANPGHSARTPAVATAAAATDAPPAAALADPHDWQLASSGKRRAAPYHPRGRAAGLAASTCSAAAASAHAPPASAGYDYSRSTGTTTVASPLALSQRYDALRPAQEQDTAPPEGNKPKDDTTGLGRFRRGANLRTGANWADATEEELNTRSAHAADLGYDVPTDPSLLRLSHSGLVFGIATPRESPAPTVVDEAEEDVSMTPAVENLNSTAGRSSHSGFQSTLNVWQQRASAAARGVLSSASRPLPRTARTTHTTVAAPKPHPSVARTTGSATAAEQSHAQRPNRPTRASATEPTTSTQKESTKQARLKVIGLRHGHTRLEREEIARALLTDLKVPRQTEIAILTFGSLNTLLELGFPSDAAAAAFYDKYIRPAGTIHTDVQDEPIRVVKHRTPAQAHRERAISKLSKVFKVLETDGIVTYPVKTDYATATVYIDRFRAASLKFPKGSTPQTHQLVLHNDTLDIFGLSPTDITAAFQRALDE